MLGLAEYVVASKELQGIAAAIEAETAKQIEGLSDQAAIKAALKLGKNYQTQYEVLLRLSLHEIAQNTAAHYEKQLKIKIPEEKMEALVADHYAEKYYGASLTTRLIFNQQVLKRRIAQSGTVGPQYLTDVYTQRVPFGSQVATDQRVLLSSIVKMEQDVARLAADQTEHKLVRWVLSRKHTQTDICDDLSRAVDDSVVEYLNEKRLRIEPKGLYFVDNLPVPPHPNCRCEFNIVGAEKEPNLLERAAKKVRQLIGKLFGK
jgi:hypothetical protein